jgi:hypothetical protein
VYCETPRKIRLVGSLGESEIASLEMYCVQLQKSGQTELLVDLDGVDVCDGAGLRGLLGLSGRTGIEVSIEGARLSQFTDLLSRVPIAEAQRLGDEVRSLVGTALGHAPGRNSSARPGFTRT